MRCDHAWRAQDLISRWQRRYMGDREWGHKTEDNCLYLTGSFQRSHPFLHLLYQSVCLATLFTLNTTALVNAKFQAYSDYLASLISRFWPDPEFLTLAAIVWLELLNCHKITTEDVDQIRSVTKSITRLLELTVRLLCRVAGK